jgi:hypothetical protein
MLYNIIKQQEQVEEKSHDNKVETFDYIKDHQVHRMVIILTTKTHPPIFWFIGWTALKDLSLLLS